MTPEKLGRYNILGELGRGAMGTVYRAQDPLIERDVAIKTLHPNLPAEVLAEVRERFVREAKSAGRLNHPSIVTIFDVGKQGDTIYIAMELLEGKSLQQMLREPARLPFPTVADIAAQIAEALDHAQQLGIVHRDVKPANVVVSDAGRAKLTDFGVAFVPSSTMTQTGTALGSPRYMSPEQVLGLRVDPRSDIFSLGVVLYEMLARRTPFERAEDSTIFPLLNRIAADPHPPVTAIDPSIPAAFEDILKKALAKKPEDRYQRAGDMARELRGMRGFEAAGAARPRADDEKTMVLPRGGQPAQAPYDKTVKLPNAARPAASTPEQEQVRSQLLTDLDSFSKNFEAEEQARIRAEEEARLKKREELRRWAEEEARKQREFDGKRASGAQPGAAPGAGAKAGDPAASTITRRAALDILKKQAEKPSPAQEKAAKKAAADAQLDHSIRLAFQYLAELARDLNVVTPTTGRPYDFFYLGRVPTVVLSEAFTDLRARKVDTKDYGDWVFFRFRARPSDPATATLLGGDISRFRNYLDALKVPFELKEEAKDDFGQTARAAVTISAPLPCEINIRADYDAFKLSIELVNVRRPGRSKCALDPKTFDGVVDDLARYVLGVDDDFDKVLGPR